MNTRGNQLSDLEVGVIRGLFAHYPGRFTNQEILSKFSVPVRTINGGRVSEIKRGHPRYAGIPPASQEEVDRFLRGEVKLHELAGELFPMKGARQVIFGAVEYDSVTLEVGTPESALLEYKVAYEAASLPVYLKIMAGMANAGQKSGSIVFGVSDSPLALKIVGVSPESPGLRPPLPAKKWREATLRHFEPFFGVRLEEGTVGDDKFGRLTVVRAQLTDAPSPPIICRESVNAPAAKKGASREILKEGAVYYRYGDSTREIRHAELRVLIDRLTKSGG